MAWPNGDPERDACTGFRKCSLAEGEAAAAARHGSREPVGAEEHLAMCCAPRGRRRGASPSRALRCVRAREAGDGSTPAGRVHEVEREREAVACRVRAARGRDQSSKWARATTPTAASSAANHLNASPRRAPPRRSTPARTSTERVFAATRPLRAGGARIAAKGVTRMPAAALSTGTCVSEDVRARGRRPSISIKIERQPRAPAPASRRACVQACVQLPRPARSVNTSAAAAPSSPVKGATLPFASDGIA